MIPELDPGPELEAEPRGSAGPAPWIVTFADLATLLMTFFVLLLSFSQLDPVRYGAAVASVRARLGASEAEQATALEALIPLPVAEAETARRRERVARAVQHLEGRIADAKTAGQVEIESGDDGFVMRVAGDVLFEAGAAELRPAALLLLHEVAALARSGPWDVAIEGHTDDAPPPERFASNWELSAARAISVLRHFTAAERVPAERLAVAGYADVRPREANDTPERRARNRRVEFAFRSRELPPEPAAAPSGPAAAGQAAPPADAPGAQASPAGPSPESSE